MQSDLGHPALSRSAGTGKSSWVHGSSYPRYKTEDQVQGSETERKKKHKIVRQSYGEIECSCGVGFIFPVSIPMSELLTELSRHFGPLRIELKKAR